MTVTNITEYGNKKYKIYIDNEFAFCLYKGELSKYGIFEDAVIDEATYDEIVNVLLLKRAKLRAMNLLKSRDYTESSMRRKLEENMYPTITINTAIEYVMSFGYIDDTRYAKDFIRCSKVRLSSSEIRRKLKDKGISDEIIQQAFIDEPIEKDEEDELIRKNIFKKCKDISALDYESRNKLYAYMYRKGFSIDKVNRVLDEIIECEDMDAM